MKIKNAIIYSKNKDLLNEIPSSYRGYFHEVTSEEHLYRFACGSLIVTDENHLIEELYELGATNVFLGPKFWDELKTLFDGTICEEFFSESFVTDNEEFKDGILKALKTLSSSKNPLLITGESGTGKTHLAKRLHHFLMGDKPFVVKNLREIPDNLMEATLFGHKRGAFTGATEDKAGLLSLADGGTLFLDEIAGLSLELQVKLLKVIEEKQFSPVGSTEVITVDFQLMTATCDDLEALIKDKKLREDFYYRLKGVGLEVPPLRSRPEDIPFLLKEWQKNFSRQLYFTEEALNSLMLASWKGNLRELYSYYKNLLSCESAVIRDVHMGPEEAVDSLPEAIAKLESKLFEKAFIKHQGRTNKICDELKISKSVFYRLQQGHGPKLAAQ